MNTSSRINKRHPAINASQVPPAKEPCTVGRGFLGCFGCLAGCLSLSLCCVSAVSVVAISPGVVTGTRSPVGVDTSGTSCAVSRASYMPDSAELFPPSVLFICSIQRGYVVCDKFDLVTIPLFRYVRAMMMELCLPPHPLRFPLYLQLHVAECRRRISPI